MPAISTSAPGKIILLGEHAVVYGHPAIAIPVQQVKAKVIIRPDIQASPGSIKIRAPEIGLDTDIDALAPDDPLGVAIRTTLEELAIERPPAMQIKISSSIPVASGLGSGAAVSVALIRSLAGFLGTSLPDDLVSKIAFEVEKIHHGTPSGIDNAVITYDRPIFFIKDQKIERLQVARKFDFIIADSGIPSPTVETVGDLRKAWTREPDRFNRYFKQIENIVEESRAALLSGDERSLGKLMTENQKILMQLDLSSPALEALVAAAAGAGAWGAKLSGGGRGGNVIAVVEPAQETRVESALKAAGAVRIFKTQLQPLSN